MSSSRIFLLSPANCSGTRAKQILSPNARFELAVALRSRRGAMLGDVFAFISGLYFRGKLTYAMRFAAPPEADNPDSSIAGTGVYVITPNAGLRGRVARQRRVAEIRRRPHGDLRRPAALSDRLRRPR